MDNSEYNSKINFKTAISSTKIIPQTLSRKSLLNDFDMLSILGFEHKCGAECRQITSVGRVRYEMINIGN
ncbi:hypothetical protein TorRG33x02_160390 [Trema orientale]|uniref:Uncharacterized protein n=1 Tax=Trema orientale TaxID=63057 RepID=A0A2P5ERN0_TREOI|nr:hypothetical protein TorRG33x02_160390 [Trema orientale]